MTAIMPESLEYRQRGGSRKPRPRSFGASTRRWEVSKTRIVAARQRQHAYDLAIVAAVPIEAHVRTAGDLLVLGMP